MEGDLRDDQWALIVPLLPSAKRLAKVDTPSMDTLFAPFQIWKPSWPLAKPLQGGPALITYWSHKPRPLIKYLHMVGLHYFLSEQN